MKKSTNMPYLEKSYFDFITTLADCLKCFSMKIEFLDREILRIRTKNKICWTVLDEKGNAIEEIY